MNDPTDFFSDDSEPLLDIQRFNALCTAGNKGELLLRLVKGYSAGFVKGLRNQLGIGETELDVDGIILDKFIELSQDCEKYCHIDTSLGAYLWTAVKRSTITAQKRERRTGSISDLPEDGANISGQPPDPRPNRPKGTNNLLWPDTGLTSRTPDEIFMAKEIADAILIGWNKFANGVHPMRRDLLDSLYLEVTDGDFSREDRWNIYRQQFAPVANGKQEPRSLSGFTEGLSQLRKDFVKQVIEPHVQLDRMFRTRTDPGKPS